VFAAKGWNRADNKLIIDTDLYDTETKQWIRDDFDISKGQTIIPSSWELYDEFKDRISINQDKTSGLISLSIEYFSPNIARKWTEKMVKAINIHIKKQDKEEALNSISYLNEKIKETNITDMQSVFYQLIEEQTKTLMLAEVSDEYVLKTISPAKKAEEISKPNRVAIFVINLLIGVIIGIMTIIIRHAATVFYKK
ncbi:MAG: LPS O-antigen length regulator, partial [Candidatus Gracilibacteria bacterium]|nr:LPS O-antigen length regulator [Candidatus Gracilibacteria bacterium]